MGLYRVCVNVYDDVEKRKKQIHLMAVWGCVGYGYVYIMEGLKRAWQLSALQKIKLTYKCECGGRWGAQDQGGGGHIHHDVRLRGDFTDW